MKRKIRREGKDAKRKGRWKEKWTIKRGERERGNRRRDNKRIRKREKGKKRRER